MKNTKNKKARFFIGSILITAFSLQFLVIGLGSFFIYSYFAPKEARAELFERQNNSFAYKTDTLRNLRQLDFRSFWGKPVKIPLLNNNPDGIPGGDRDYIIIFPPKILDRNASVPLRAIYLASGKTVEPDNAQFVQNIEQYVNTVGQNNSILIEIIKNLLQNNLRMSIKDNDSLFSNIKNFLGNNNFPFSVAKADDSTNTTGNSPLLTSDDISQLTSNLDSMDTSNPQVKQLLTLVLILITVNQSLAKSLNSDKQACLDMGGDWVNGACQSEQKAACEDNGGTFRKFTNQCLADKQTCGNEDLQCDNSNDNSSLPEPSWLDNSNENNNQDNSVYTCACKSGYCMSDEGTCVSKNNTKKKACENSGGSWKNFFDPVELCMQTCGATQTACANFSNNYSGSSSSQGLMGCDCSSSESSDRFNTNASSAGKCLSKEGSCIAKETTNSDDDNDGVPNGQDRCPNSQPDGSGTVNKQAGSPYYGCTCTQIQALGGVPQQQQRQQCPPDGCEGEFLVTYDRSSQYNQMNNNQPLCQNGIVQQQQYQQQQYQQQQYPYGQYGQNGQYGANGNCPVISRVPNETCQRMNNNNNNNNNNKSLEDLLKDLLKDKNNKDNKGGGDKGGNDKGGGGGGGDKGGGNDSNSNNKNDSNSNTNSAQASGTPATSPKGVGEFNASQTGTAEKPYQLHVSQFKKVCGENTYILTSAVPGTGKFKDDPKKAGQVNPGGKPLNDLISSLSKLTTCGPSNRGCPDANELPTLSPKVGEAKKKMSDQWGKLNQEQQQSILNILSGNGSGTDRVNNALNAYDKAVQENQAKTQTPAPSGSKAANSMKDLDEANPYFKVPKCEELAQAHCCVCSCCDKSKKDCGWSIGKDCKDGKCNGPACDESCSKCSEDPAKSIALVMGNPIPAKLKQGDNKCYEIDHNKEKTASKLYENYDEVMHVGQCRYDGKGSTAGCEDTPQGKDCKIIIKGKEIESFTINGSTTKPRPEKDAQYVEFPNHQDGSVVQVSSGQKPSSTDWIQKLANEPDKAKACKCGERPSEKNPDQFPDGWIHPGQNQPQEPKPGNSYQNTDPWPTDSDLNKINQQNQQKPNQPPSNQVSDWAKQPPQPTAPTPSESNDPFPSEWPEPVTEDGQNMRPGATNPVPNTQQPATAQPQTGQPESSNQSTTGWQQVQNTWNSFKNFIKEVWNWGTFKHSGE